MKALILGIAGAIIGALLIFAGLHVYGDHHDLHVLVEIVQQAQKQAVEKK